MENKPRSSPERYSIVRGRDDEVPASSGSEKHNQTIESDSKSPTRSKRKGILRREFEEDFRSSTETSIDTDASHNKGKSPGVQISKVKPNNSKVNSASSNEEGFQFDSNISLRQHHLGQRSLERHLKHRASKKPEDVVTEMEERFQRQGKNADDNPTLREIRLRLEDIKKRNADENISVQERDEEDGI